jgi:hypothetical protein
MSADQHQSSALSGTRLSLTQSKPQLATTLGINQRHSAALACPSRIVKTARDDARVPVTDACARAPEGQGHKDSTKAVVERLIEVRAQVGSLFRVMSV